MTARIAELVCLESLSAAERKRVFGDLTYRVYDPVEGTTTTIRDYFKDGSDVFVPRQYGLDFARMYNKPLKDETSNGYVVQFPKHVSLYPYQEPFVFDILTEFVDGSHDIMAEAATGKGKTVMSCEVAARLGVTTIVVVDQGFLRDQWIDAAQKFLGMDRSRIGIIQGSRCEYEGKDFVVAMVQTLYQKDLADEVYEHFGLVVFDEVHTVGAEQFSVVLGMFPARYRLGVSATPDRGDALQDVLEAHLGPVSVRLQQEHIQSIVRYVEYDRALSWYANVSPKTGRYVNEIAADTERNELIVRIIMELRESGRDVLAVSDRIEHLENLMAMAQYMGIDPNEMGLVSGYRTVWAYSKDATPPRRPYGWEKGTNYTPVCLQMLRKKIPKQVLKDTKQNKPILFATYGMFNKGVDVQRLGAGIDCTPRSKAKQVHGRILREMDGKLVPIWVTIRDKMSYKAEYQFLNRLSEYRESNAEVYQWNLEKGVRLKDGRNLAKQLRERIAKLKQCKILTGPDGNNTVITPSTGKQQKSAADKRTERSTRRR